MLLFYAAVVLATASIIDASPGSFNCLRPGQDCTLGNKCDNGVCQCGKNKLYDCSVTAETDGPPCKAESCNGNGLCVGNGVVAVCFCNAGWDIDTIDTCIIPRYKVYCSRDSMIINVAPHGIFTGVVYETNKATCQLTKQYDDATVDSAVSDLLGLSKSPFTWGVVGVIYSNGTLDGSANACSEVTMTAVDDGDPDTNVYVTKRKFIVQYHPDYLTKEDEQLVAECRMDLKAQMTQVTMGSITNNPSKQQQVNAATVSDDFGTKLAFTDRNLKLSSPTGEIGEEKCLRLRNFKMKIFIKKVVVTNNFPGNYKEVILVENSCKAKSSGKLGSIWKGYPQYIPPYDATLFCFGLFTIKPTSTIAIKVWFTLCPKGVAGCHSVDCSSNPSQGRRKRETGTGSMQDSELELRGIRVYGMGIADSEKEDLPPTTTECDIDDRMFVAVIALAVIVFLLLLLLAALVVRTHSSPKQQSSWREKADINTSYFGPEATKTKQ